MSNAAEVIGRLYEAAEFIRLARLKIDGAKCLMAASGQYRNDEYLMLQASEIDMNLWAEIRNLRELAQKCDR
jgi:hypothetical protein